MYAELRVTVTAGLGLALCDIHGQLMWLKDKSALITGASRGIGRGIALKLAENGAAKICINYLSNESEANHTLTKVRELGADGFVCRADVNDPAQIAGMYERIRQEFGTLDVMVSNARIDLGTGFYQSPLDIPLEKFELAFDSQVRAFHLLVREMVPLLPASGGGRIIAISYSPSGRTGSWQPWCAMGAAKAALDALSRYYAVALASRGVTVNVVSPGATDDSVLSRLPSEVFGAIRQWHESGWTPMRRMGTPADVGNAVAMLCTEEASFVTGQTVHVDGGASIMDPVFPLAIQGIA
jgi:NAD(P)-dependent dehydrogenase (short-subunit alcohol dehydrogenase family)